jgi:hypothetical protein
MLDEYCPDGNYLEVKKNKKHVCLGENIPELRFLL